MTCFGESLHAVFIMQVNHVPIRTMVPRIPMVILAMITMIIRIGAVDTMMMTLILTKCAVFVVVAVTAVQVLHIYYYINIMHTL